jgi:hypothetical protein
LEDKHFHVFVDVEGLEASGGDEVFGMYLVTRGDEGLALFER